MGGRKKGGGGGGGSSSHTNNGGIKMRGGGVHLGAGRKNDSMRDAAAVCASLGLTAVADAHGDGAMKRKKAFKTFVQRAVDGAGGRCDASETVSMTSDEKEEAKMHVMRVTVADIEKSCGGIGCAWCVKEFIDGVAKGNDETRDGDCTSAHRRIQTNIPFVEMELEDQKTHERSDAALASSPVVVVRAGANARSSTRAAWMEQIAAFVVDQLGSERAGKSGALLPMLRRMNDTTASASMPQSQSDAAVAVAAKMKREELNAVSNRMQAAIALKDEWAKDTSIGVAANDGVAQLWVAFSKSFMSAFAASRDVELKSKAFEEARANAAGIGGAAGGGGGGLANAGHAAKGRNAQQLKKAFEEASRNLVASTHELQGRVHAALQFLDQTLDALNSFYNSKVNGSTASVVATGSKTEFVRASGEVQKARILLLAASKEVERRPGTAEEKLAAFFGLVESHRVHARNLVLRYIDTHMDSVGRVVIQEVDSDDEDDEDDENAVADEEGSRILAEEVTRLSEMVDALTEEVSLAEEKEKAVGATGRSLAVVVTCGLSILGTCEEFLAAEAVKAMEDLEAEEEKRREKEKADKEKAMLRKRKEMEEKEEKHARRVAEMKSAAAAAASGQRLRKVTFEVEEGSEEEEEEVLEEKREDDSRRGRGRPPHSTDAPRTTMARASNADSSEDRDFAEQLNAAIKESMREEEARRRNRSKKVDMVPSAPVTFGETRAVQVVWPVRKAKDASTATATATPPVVATKESVGVSPVNPERYIDPEISFLSSLKAKPPTPPPPPFSSSMPPPPSSVAAAAAAAVGGRAEDLCLGRSAAAASMQWSDVAARTEPMMRQQLYGILTPSDTSEPSSDPDDMNSRYSRKFVEPVDETVNSSSSDNVSVESSSGVSVVKDEPHATQSKLGRKKKKKKQQQQQEQQQKQEPADQHLDKTATIQEKPEHAMKPQRQQRKRREKLQVTSNTSEATQVVAQGSVASAVANSTTKVHVEAAAAVEAAVGTEEKRQDTAVVTDEDMQRAPAVEDVVDSERVEEERRIKVREKRREQRQRRQQRRRDAKEAVHDDQPSVASAAAMNEMVDTNSTSFNVADDDVVHIVVEESAKAVPAASAPSEWQAVTTSIESEKEEDEEEMPEIEIADANNTSGNHQQSRRRRRSRRRNDRGDNVDVVAGSTVQAVMPPAEESVSREAVEVNKVEVRGDAGRTRAETRHEQQPLHVPMATKPEPAQMLETQTSGMMTRVDGYAPPSQRQNVASASVVQTAATTARGGVGGDDATRQLLLHSLSRSLNEARARVRITSQEADRSFQMCLASDVDYHTKRCYVLLFSLEDARKDVAVAECELARLRFNTVASTGNNGARESELESAERALAEARARETKALQSYESHALLGPAHDANVAPPVVGSNMNGTASGGGGAGQTHTYWHPPPPSYGGYTQQQQPQQPHGVPSIPMQASPTAAEVNYGGGGASHTLMHQHQTYIRVQQQQQQQQQQQHFSGAHVPQYSVPHHQQPQQQPQPQPQQQQLSNGAIPSHLEHNIPVNPPVNPGFRFGQFV